MDRKVMVLPCSGIGKPSGEIGRQAAFQVTRQLKPETTEMACLARLVIDDPETIDLIRNNLVITLDGCSDDCAKKNVERFGKTVDGSIHVADLLAAHPELHPLGILNLGDDGVKLVDLLAAELAAQVDRLSTEEG